MSDPPNSKDRKKSAHWTDADTSILIDVLLRYKDAGRTQDNGFKPEVWREAADLVKGSTVMGGPKTPEACKSRWQRLQRDFKAVRELETLPGFTFDRSVYKLSASQEAWDNAEKTTEAYKCQKIHLPSYDALLILCPPDNQRLRPRNQTKPRSSLGATSDTSSLLSISVGNPQTPQLTGMHGTPTGGVVSSHVMDMNMGDNMMQWTSSELDTGPDFEGSFAMPDGQVITMSRPQKRMTFDPSMLGSSHGIQLEPRNSPSKRARTESYEALQQQVMPQQQPMTFPIHLPPQPQNSPDLTINPQGLDHNRMIPSPTQLTSASLQAVTGHQANPQHHQPHQQQHQHHQHHQHQLQQYHHPQPQQPQQPQMQQMTASSRPDLPIRYAPPSQPPPQPTPTPPVDHRISPSIPDPPIDKSQLIAASLNEAQRRTQAILQLQAREGDMTDADMVEVLAEFEKNVAAADTYLAIQRDGLRRMWLAKVVTRRKGG